MPPVRRLNAQGQMQWVDSDTGQPYDAVTAARLGLGAADTPAPAAAPTTQPTTAQPAATSQPATSQPATTPPTPHAGISIVPEGQQAPPGTEAYQKAVDEAKNGYDDANSSIFDATQRLNGLQKDLADPNNLVRAPQIQAQINDLYTEIGRLETVRGTASQQLATAITNAADHVALTPDRVALLQSQAKQASAAADEANARAKSIVEGSESQRALAVAQAGEAAARGRQADAEAAARNATTPAQINQLNAQADEARGLAAVYGSQVAINQEKVNTERAQGRLTSAQADQAETDNQTRAASNQAALELLQLSLDQKRKGALTEDDAQQINKSLVAQGIANVELTQAQAGAQQAGAAAQQATAAKTLEDIQKGRLGPAYGLQDQIKAISDVYHQVFGPGGSGDVNQANDLLNQYVTATIGGQKLGEAAQQAGTYAQNIYGYQAGQQEEAQRAAAQRAQTYASTAGNVLGTLAGLNANAPAGSTAGAAAFQQIMGQVSQQMGGPQSMQPVAAVQAPNMPTYLQAFMQGHQAGSQAAASTGTTPVTINVGSSAGTGGPSPTAAMGGTTPQTLPTEPLGGGLNMPSGPIQTPNWLQGFGGGAGNQPATMYDLTRLYNPQLASGQVQFPKVA